MSYFKDKLEPGVRSLPLIRSLYNYNSDDFRKDLVAGLTVGVILVPQGMAYALLAGLPPVYGLYASLFPTALYALFGSSRQLSVGPVAMSSLLVLAGISAFAEPGSEKFIALAITTALFVGLVQVAFGFFKLGFLVNFLSHPVIKGFTAAAALIIAGSQLGHLLGLVLPQSNHVDVLLASTVQQLHLVHPYTFLLSVGAIALIIILRAVHKSIPGALIAVAVGIAVVSFFSLAEQGVATVGAVPRGLPALQMPQFSYADMRSLMSLAFLLTFVSMIESIAIAKAIEGRNKSYRLNPNQELIALGLSKIFASFFQAYPTTGSFSRSAVNSEAGARTGISSFVAAALVALTLIFLTPLFYALPKAVLAVIIVTAVSGLIDISTARKLWRTHRSDFYMMLATFVATLFLGIIQGVLAGVILSLVLMVYRSTKPHCTILGRIPGTNHYRNVSRFPQAEQPESTLIVRFDAPIFFGNANFFRETLEQFIDEKGDTLRNIIFDASSVYDIDSSGINMLEEIINTNKASGIRFILAGAIGPLRDRLFRAELMDGIGYDNQFMDVYDAVMATQGNVRETGHALQTNIRGLI
ncbi:MAG TPA: solute carrier family 26 protein [Saprospiraceae bacterium]|nr:solute carrier family 26 protein [Saprospiraceae bacterium]